MESTADQLNNFKIVLDVDPEFIESANKYKSCFKASITTLYDLRFVGYLSVQPVAIDAAKLQIKAADQLVFPAVTSTVTSPLKRSRERSIDSTHRTWEVTSDAGSSHGGKKRKVVTFKLNEKPTLGRVDHETGNNHENCETAEFKNAEVQIRKVEVVCENKKNEEPKSVETKRRSILKTKTELSTVDIKNGVVAERNTSEIGTSANSSKTKKEERKDEKTATKEAAGADTSFKCMKCEKQFKSKVTLKNHYVKVHNYPENTAKALVAK